MKFDYLKTGSGEPLLLVHGALADLRMWYPVQMILAESFEVYSFSQRYFGLSTDYRAVNPFGYQTHAEDLCQFIDTQIQQPCHVVAWSYGADVALLAAKMKPSLFKSAFLYEPSRQTHLKVNKDLEIYNEDLQKMLGSLPTLLEEFKIEQSVEALIDALAGQEGYFASQKAVNVQIQLENSETLFLQLKQSKSIEVTCKDIAQFDFKCCFVRGSQTRDVFRIATDRAVECSRYASHRVLQDAGHMLPLQAPKYFAEQVKYFLCGTKYFGEKN